MSDTKRKQLEKAGFECPHCAGTGHATFDGQNMPLGDISSAAPAAEPGAAAPADTVEAFARAWFEDDDEVLDWDCWTDSGKARYRTRIAAALRAALTGATGDAPPPWAPDVVRGVFGATDSREPWLSLAHAAQTVIAEWWRDPRSGAVDSAMVRLDTFTRKVLAGAPGRAAPTGPSDKQKEAAAAFAVLREGVSGPEQGAAGAPTADVIDALAQDIRRVDGWHSLGAGALAERLAALGWSRRAALRSAPPTREGT